MDLSKTEVLTTEPLVETGLEELGPMLKADRVLDVANSDDHVFAPSEDFGEVDAGDSDDICEGEEGKNVFIKEVLFTMDCKEMGKETIRKHSETRHASKRLFSKRKKLLSTLNIALLPSLYFS